MNYRDEFPIEIKVNISGPVQQALAKLAHDAGEHRNIWFAESTVGLQSGRLALHESHVIVRLRCPTTGSADLTVKLRPCHTDQLTRHWKRHSKAGHFKYRIEGDWSGDDRRLAASAVADVSRLDAITAVDRARNVYPVLVEKQRRFLDDCTAVRTYATELTPLGPINATKYTHVPIGPFDATAERWTITDFDMLELSIRAEREKNESHGSFLERAESMQTVLRNVVTDLGFHVDESAQPKTERVMTTLAALHR